MSEDEIADLRSRLAELSSYPTPQRLAELIALATIELPHALDVIDLLKIPPYDFVVLEYLGTRVHLKCSTCGRDFWDDAVVMAGKAV